jgi:hypothetical protein
MNNHVPTTFGQYGQQGSANGYTLGVMRGIGGAMGGDLDSPLHQGTSLPYRHRPVACRQLHSKSGAGEVDQKLVESRFNFTMQPLPLQAWIDRAASRCWISATSSKVSRPASTDIAAKCPGSGRCCMGVASRLVSRIRALPYSASHRSSLDSRGLSRDNRTRHKSLLRRRTALGEA